MKEEIQSSEKLLQEYKKVVDAGAIVSKTDVRGKITYANEQFCKISGYSLDELIGKNHNIVRDPDVAADIYKDLWETIKRKETWKGKIKNRAKNGSSYYVNAIVIPILDESDEVIEYVALRQDITELEELNNFLEKRVNEEVEKNRKKDEESISILTSFLENSPNPIVVYKNDIVQYANSKFLTLINKNESEIIGSMFALDTLFDNKSGCINTLEELEPIKNRNRVSISMEVGRNIFEILVNDIPYIDDTVAKMYTFNNITLVEYQKLKIRHYNERLEDFIKKLNKNKYENRDSLVKDDEKIKRVLNSKEKEVLKRSRDNVQISSAEYSQDIDAYILEEIEELSEIEIEINELIRLFNNEKSVDFLGVISIKFFKYASTVSLLIDFEDLSFAIKSLGDLLQTIKVDDLDDTKYKKIELYLLNILLDLSNWRRTIFIDRRANDIHYLDSSLFSTILQFELIFNDAEVINDGDDDFEFF